jgi:hypothetical protein
MTNTEPTRTRRAQTLGTVLGLIDGARKMAHTAVTSLHRESRNVERFNGFSRTYEPDAVADGAQPEQLPAEGKLVELNGEQMLTDLAGALSRRLDLQLTMDAADQNAVADIREPDGNGGERVLLANVPVTTLLVLEKILEDVRKYVRTLPILDPSREWSPDPNATGVYVAAPVQTVRNKKIPKVVTKAQATDKHQADTELYWADERAGLWTRVERTGALPPRRAGGVLQRVEQLFDAVHTARNEANQTTAPDRQLGDPLFNFLLNGH